MRFNFKSCVKGMTLLETMIALLIFSLGVMGVAAMQVSSMFNNAKARRSTYDAVAACEQMEAIFSLPYEDPLLSDPDEEYAPSSPDHGPFVVPSTLSTIEWEVEDQFPIPNAKRISVKVRVVGKGGADRILAFEYIKTRGFPGATARSN